MPETSRNKVFPASSSSNHPSESLKSIESIEPIGCAIPAKPDQLIGFSGTKNPMKIMGKSMVSGEDFPFFVNLLTRGAIYSFFPFRSLTSWRSVAGPARCKRRWTRWPTAAAWTAEHNWIWWHWGGENDVGSTRITSYIHIYPLANEVIMYHTHIYIYKYVFFIYTCIWKDPPFLNRKTHELSTGLHYQRVPSGYFMGFIGIQWNYKGITMGNDEIYPLVKWHSELVNRIFDR